MLHAGCTFYIILRVGIEVTIPIGLVLLSQMYILIQKVVLVCSGSHTIVSSKSCFITVNGSESQ